MKQNPILLAAGALALMLSTILWAEDWPQWRGPSGNSVSQETELPFEWTQEQNVIWKLAMPAWSGSTPVVWDDLVFLNVAENDDLYLWTVDRKSGEVRWKAHLGGGNRKMRKQNMSSPSPVTDGRTVWVMTGTGVLKAFDFEGKLLWERNIQKDYGDFGLNWGYASSPLLHHGTLYIQVLHGMKTDDPSYVMAVEGATGKTLWRVERPTDAPMESPDSYATPALLQVEGRTEIVVSGGDYVTGHDPGSGKETWRIGGLNPGRSNYYRIVASPTVCGEMIFVPSRVKPMLALRAGAAGVSQVWSTDNGPDVPTPVCDQQRLYVVNDKGIMYAFDRGTGEPVWGPERLQPGIYSSSPVLADGRIYVTSEDGMTSVVAAGPKFQLLAENDLAGYTLSSPAISHGQLFMRTADALYCIGN